MTQPDPTKLADLCEALEVAFSYGCAQCNASRPCSALTPMANCPLQAIARAQEVVSEPVEPPMTDPRDVDSMVTKLLRRHTRDGYPDHLINPDGPEAATTITALQAEVAVLREALCKIDRGMVMSVAADTARAALTAIKEPNQ